ncbi:MAG: A/G-specific adenine glycosylase [Pseudomonadota bacterium]
MKNASAQLSPMPPSPAPPSAAPPNEQDKAAPESAAQASPNKPLRRKSKPGPTLADRLLAWYDQHARSLPWRVSPDARRAGVMPDPYSVWLSEIMLQQTTVATVSERYVEFLERWPTVEALAAAPLDDVLAAWAGLGYYARARNLHACARVIVDDYGGVFPRTVDGLKELPGIGDYTAAAIAAIAFDGSDVVLDGNIERVGARQFLIATPVPKSKPAIRKAWSKVWPNERSGDFAQALMDLGATVCKPRNPDCPNCPIETLCVALQEGDPSSLPKKAAKKAKPTRYGQAYVLRNADGDVLFERRPEQGLLGGMLGLPGTDWRAESQPAAGPLFETVNGGKPKHREAPRSIKSWRYAGEARHTFTHFHLVISVYVAETRGRAKPDEIWLPPSQARLPTAMKKVLEAGALT